MNKLPNTTTRIHSLDALRAIMMLLGIVLHSTEIYLIQPNAPFPKDPNSTHIFLDYLEYLIHMFRMPIFFLIAGFFGSLLFYERSPLIMMKNRMERIVLPFITFLLLLSPIIVFALSFTNSVFEGIQNAFENTISKFLKADIFIPESTYHLWFLYYLIFITAFIFLFAIVLRNLIGLKRRILNAFRWILTKPILKIFIFSFMHFIVLLIIWDLSGGTPLGFKPEIEPFIFYTYFYLIGWLLYKSKDILDSFKEYDWIYALLGIILFTVRFIYSDTLDDVTLGIMHSIIVWFFVFGFMGLFIRYSSNPSKRMRYVSDASYWVYLVHLPMTLIIPGLIADWAIHAVLKFAAVAIFTGMLSFVSYHYLVRSSFVGKFLNGKKYS